MNTFRKYRLLILALLIGIGAYASIVTIKKQPNSLPPSQDTLINKLQSFLDTSYNKISDYCRTESELAICRYQIELNAQRSKEIADSMNTLLNKDLYSFYTSACTSKTSAKPDEKTQQAFKALNSRLSRFEAEQTRLGEETKTQNNLVLALDGQLKMQRKNYDAASKSLTNLCSPLREAGLLVIKNRPYRFFIASTANHLIHIHNSKSDGPASIETLKKEESKSNTPLMITNGGMFMPGYGPQGLLIEDGKIKHDIDTAHPVNSNLNFFLLPNGVFYIDAAGKFNIEETQEFRKNFAKNKAELQFATQSGPLLFHKKEVNKNFRAGSENLNIRSGVGIINGDQVVFVISDTRVNFFDFALIFREIFHCSSALYLDGAISQMYISDKLLKKAPMPTDGMFGPLISITPKKKS
jgi:uncharacterized protein YigE (DUF2233 family)